MRRFETDMRSSRRIVPALVSMGVAIGLLTATVRPLAQTAPVGEARGAYDAVLDTYVRDGLVYYRALRSDRSKLDSFVSAIATASVDGASRGDQLAFWLNAYNALVLRAVIDQYPIPQRSKDYPARSIRQIPGVFERTPRRVAGRTLTLDQIEQTVLTTFDDPRVFLALGRGAVGSGRLRSEAYTGADIERQLADAAGECVRRAQCINIDRDGNAITVNAVFSWRERDFTASYTERSDPRFAARSPVERAVLGFIAPKLLTTEREFIERNQFQVRFQPFDWSLNDLTGR